MPENSVKFPAVLKINQQHIWADYLRVYATIAVITVHVTAQLTYSYGKIETKQWLVTIFIGSVVRFCVPVFVMLSGAFLLGKEEDLSVFLTKRLNKIAIPFVAWLFIYSGYNVFFSGREVDTYESVKAVLSGKVALHLWFMYMIIGLYLVTPVFRKWLKLARQKEILYFIFLWFLTSSIIPFLENILRFDIEFSLESVSGYTGYFILGYYLVRFPIAHRYLASICFAIFVLMVGVTFAGTYILSEYSNNYNAIPYEYLSANVVFMSIAFFLFIKNKYQNNNKRELPILFRFINNTSFGIYLIHILILYLLEKNLLGFNLTASFIHPIIGIPLTSLICLIISFCCVFVIQRLPVIKKIVG